MDRKLLRYPVSSLGQLGIVLACCAFSFVPAHADEPVSTPAAATTKSFVVEERLNLVYRELEKREFLPRNRLDLYLPKGAKDFPVVLLVHGGAWMGGDKAFLHLDFIPEIAHCLARHGIGVVTANYRLAPAFAHPAQIQDVAKAFAWTQKHISEYGGRADQIFLFGHSAGGHLVSLLATDESHLKREGLHRGHVKGVITISGVYEISPVAVGMITELAKLEMKVNPYHLVFGKDQEVARSASPLTHVQAGLPPFLVVYAEKDLPTLADMAKKFTTALKNSQCEVQLIEVAGRNHLTVMWEVRKPTDQIARAVLGFIQRYTKEGNGEAGK